MKSSISFVLDVGSPLYEDRLKRAADRVLKLLNIDREVNLTIRLVNDEVIRLLNLEYLEKDRPTDVLSFPVHEFDRGRPPKNLPQGPLLLGEVVVNLDQAKRQAWSSGHNLGREVQSLVEHGVRHLIGFHH